MISWVAALKLYNTGKDSWCIPKKGSAGHREVRQLMNAPAAADSTPYWSKFADVPRVKKPSRKFRDDDYDSVDVAGELAAVKEARAMGRSLYSLEGKNPFKRDTPKKKPPKLAPYKGGPVLFGAPPKAASAKLLVAKRK